MVTSNPAEAARLVADGGHAVLIVSPGAAPITWPTGPGRMAVLVGDPNDANVRAAGEAMLAELFSKS